MTIAANTPLWYQLAFDRGKHASAGKWPRMAHLQDHLDSRHRAEQRTAELRAVLPLLLEPHTIAGIADLMAPGWTPRQVELAGGLIMRAMGMEGHLSHGRLRLVGIAAGVSPCVCESIGQV